MPSRKNVIVARSSIIGEYYLYGKSGRLIVRIDNRDWDDLAAARLAKGQSAVIDLRVSGLPRKRKAKKCTRK